MPRNESEIFDELKKLCGRKGYAHVIAYLSFRENTVLLNGEVRPQDFYKSSSDFKIVGNELTFLTGLMVKNKIDFSFPNQESIDEMISETEALLQELHDCFNQPMRDTFERIARESVSEDVFGTAAMLREAIFYGGDSAYDFQYLDFVCQKYIAIV